MDLINTFAFLFKDAIHKHEQWGGKGGRAALDIRNHLRSA